MIRVVFGVLAALCLLVSCDRPTFIAGECELTEDCHTEWNNIPDTTCINGYCTCNNPAEDHCCFRDNLENCTKDKEDSYRCRPKEQCDPMAPFIFPDAGADASDGG